jgi:Cu-processing system permease protein
VSLRVDAATGDAESETARAGDDTESSVSDAARHPAFGRLRTTADDLWALARREYRVTSRARWTAGLAGLFALLSVAAVLLGASSVGPTRYTTVVATLTELSAYLVPLAGLTLGVGSIAGADEQGSLDVLLALPVTRARLLAGLYLGRATTLLAGVTLGFGAGGVLLLALAGTSGWALYARLLFAVLACGLAFLAVGVLLSTLAGETTHALGGSLLAWLYFVLLHDLAALALVAGTGLGGTTATLLALANPVDLLRVAVLSGLPTTGGGLSAVLPATALSLPVVALGFALWVGAPLAAATAVLARR